MTSSINTAAFNQFNGNMYHLASQEVSRLMGLFPVENGKGEIHFFDRLSGGGVTKVTSRNQPTSFTDLTHTRRACTIDKYDMATALDGIDVNKMLSDPTSSYLRQHGSAHGRNFDDVIIGALVGTAMTGKDGTGSQAFDTTNQQVASGSTGMSTSKLLSALEILKAAEVDISELYCVVGSAGENDLLADADIKSIDTNSSKPLASGVIGSYLGVTFIRSERIPNVSGEKAALLFTPRAAKFAMLPSQTRVDVRPDLSYAKQLYTESWIGGVRMAENEIVRVLYV